MIHSFIDQKIDQKNDIHLRLSEQYLVLILEQIDGHDILWRHLFQFQCFNKLTVGKSHTIV